MISRLEIHLLGGLQISQNGAPINGFISSKAPALLAYLAVTRRPHRREALAGLLWGGMPAEAAANNLRQTLTNLRKLVEPHLSITRDRVAFEPAAPYTLDIEDFTRLVSRQRDHPSSQRLNLLREGVTLYRGDFLAGFYIRDAPDFEEWVLLQRVQLRDLALDSLGTLTQLLLESGQCQEAIVTSGQLLALDPWREEAHRWRMLALVRCQQGSAALAQYQTCRAILRREFDAEPTAETTSLYERIRAAQAGRRHNLPAPVTGFVGRQRELAEMRALLATPATRLLTLVGPGGVGKTRLALEVARNCQSLFLNGVWFLSPTPTQPADPEQLAHALAHALNCPASGRASAVAQIIAFLRSKELLLVLDNLEEWLTAKGWLSQLLTQAPDVKILAVSRQRLDLQAERLYPLAGLPLPAPQDDPLTADAVTLFQRRARRVQADYTLTPAEASAAAHICRLVEGLPLGIELAAAWVRQLSCAQIAAEIEASLDFLTTEREDVTPRQHSLRAAFDWSWGRLSVAEQTVFAQLAAFHGPFAYAAAQAVAAASRQVLAALVDKSLLWQRGQFYQLHETARRFGLEKLAQTGNSAAVQTRHAHYYAHLLAQHAAALQGHNQPASLAAIEHKLENIIAAWRWLGDTRDTAGLEQAADGLYHFLALRSLFLVGVELFGAARRALQPAADAAAQLTYGRMMAREGRFLSFLSSYAEAKTLLQASLAIARDAGDQDEIAFALNHLGGTARLEGDLALAQEYIQASLALRRQTSHLGGQAVALLELGGIAFMAAEYEVAYACCHEGLPIAEAAGDLQTTAHLLTGLSLICRQLRRYPDALAYGQRGQDIYQTLGDRYGVIQAGLTLGELSRQLGRREEARAFAAQAVQVSQEIGHRSGEAEGHLRLGQIAAEQGEPTEALSHIRLALTLAHEIRELPIVLEALLEMGCLLAAVGDSQSAQMILHFLHQQPQLAPPVRARLTQVLAGRVEVRFDRLTASLSLADIVSLASR